MRSPAVRRLGRSRSVLARLLLLAGIPFVLFAVAAGAWASELGGASSAARSAVGAVDGSSELLSLYDALMTERTVGGALAAAGELGISSDSASQLYGADLVAGLGRARARVDRLAAVGGGAVDAGDAVELAVLRAGVDAGTATQQEVLRSFGARAAAVRKRWVSSLVGVRALGAPGSTELARALDALLAAGEVVALGWDRYLVTASLVVPGLSASGQTALDLAAASALYEQAAGRLPAALDDVALDAWEREVVASPDARAFEHLVASAREDPAAAAATDLVTTARTFHSGVILQGGLAHVAALTHEQVRSIAADVHRDAQRRLWAYLGAVSVIGGTTVLGAVVLARSIARPLRHLAGRAGELSAGAVHIESLEVGGPREIAESMQAFNEALANLRHLHAGVLAMADGDPVAALDDPPPGALGATLVTALSRLSASMEEGRALQDELRTQALRDELTGLPNRRLVMELLHAMVRQAKRSGEPLALLFIDLDRFKEVNDTQGHAAGDTVLERTARRLLGVCRKADVVGRMGGDEFVVISRSTHGEATNLGQRIDEALARPFDLGDGVTVACPASIGIAELEAESTAEALLASADAAMYAVKERRHARR